MKSLSFSLRSSLIGLSLTGFASGSEQLLNYPMTGACFLHDSGLEYIPSRLMGVEDIATDSDRGESATWTCTDPAADCAAQAEKFEERQVAIEQWNRWHSAAELLRDWSAQSFHYGIARSVRAWNSSIGAIGGGFAHRVSIDRPFDGDCSFGDDCARDDVEASGGAYGGHCLGYLPSPRLRNANIFVFKIDTRVEKPADELAIQQQQEMDASQVASPSDRIVDSLAKTTFARDYCVFAPYALSDAIASSSPCEWIGECQALDSHDISVADVQADSQAPPLAETMEEIGASSSPQISKPPEYSQPTEFDQASDRGSGAGPEHSADADGMFDSASVVDSREILGIPQRVAAEVQRSVARILARNLSAVGRLLNRWSEELDNRVRLSESLDASRLDEWK